DPMYFKEILNRNGINAGAAARKFALLDFDQKGVSGAVRISPHYYNTFEEVDKMIAVIKENTI
ncbi:MAG TPA: aminotransferase class V-fold PLP-dependent enzyme, partial [Chitinophagales bacterium]|nr:aminotransferase class V-fold PLP-dependent enzyme [Chitinophagales bacterium]